MSGCLRPDRLISMRYGIEDAIGSTFRSASEEPDAYCGQVTDGEPLSIFRQRPWPTEQPLFP